MHCSIDVCMITQLSEMPRALKRAMNFLGVESVKNVTIIHHDPIVPVGHFYSTFGDLPYEKRFLFLIYLDLILKIWTVLAEY